MTPDLLKEIIKVLEYPTKLKEEDRFRLLKLAYLEENNSSKSKYVLKANAYQAANEIERQIRIANSMSFKMLADFIGRFINSSEFNEILTNKK